MEGIGQFVARRAAPPRVGVAPLGRLSHRVRPATVRHADPLEGSPATAMSSSRSLRSISVLRAADIKRLAVRPGTGTESVAGLAGGLDQATAAMDALRSAAVSEARLFGFADAADFAGKVEEISRTVEFLQIVAAEAVERTRCEAQAALQSSPAPAWRTGWTEPAATASDPEVPVPAPAASLTEVADAVDDGYRNAAEFLRARLRISIGEARRRLALASVVLPQAGIAGQEISARHEVLAEALSSADMPSRSATVISVALDQVRHITDGETALQMEQSLTDSAVQSDPDFVSRMAKRWVDAIDQDGSEPSQEELRQRQGAFIRKPRRGLHHMEIFATAEQFETLATVMNTATNPRLRQDTDGLDRRSRAQKLLDGLIGACGVALSTGELPATGGLRPQVMVTIDYRDLLDRVEHQPPLPQAPA